jgi:hypothetical protein
MHWLEAVNQHIASTAPAKGRRPTVTGATVESTPIPRGVLGYAYGPADEWVVEERKTPRGNIALHLFPSVS